MDLAGTIGRAIVGVETPKTPVARGAHEETLETGKSIAPVLKTSSSAVDPAHLVSVGGGNTDKKADDEKSAEEERRLSKEEADQLAERLKSAISQTTVSFDVSVDGTSEGGLRFRVVDKETGKVVREFMPKHVVDVLHKAADGLGLVLDDQA